MTIIKNAKPELKIRNVFHWPKTFKKDDKVKSSFRIDNIGNAATNILSVILYINGEEKNKVGDIVIPAGGYANIKIPWIALKGKNEIDIVVK